jgi:hypothetical protein
MARRGDGMYAARPGGDFTHEGKRHQGVGAAMSIAELQIGLGVTEEQLGDAVTVARLSDDLFVTFTAPDRLTLGPSWRARCKDREQPVR